MITRDQAWEKVTEWLENKNLQKHCLAVEAAMLGYAEKFKVGDKEKWAVVGLVHDADWEKWPKEHPQRTLDWLKENGADEEMLNAVASHGAAFGIEPKSQMAKVLRSVDELTGLIIATALVHPNRKLSEVTLGSVLSKWKDKSFAKGVNREEIEAAADELEVNLKDHLQTVLLSLQKISVKLNL
jgi:predicted hydrolase (HD superfamily)